MGLGGNLQLDDAVLPISIKYINILHAGIHERQQLRRIETPKGLLRDLEDFPNQRHRRLHLFVLLGDDGPQPMNRLEVVPSRVR